MGRERTRPRYKLDEAKALAASGKLQISKRANRFITNRIGPGCAKETVKEIFRKMGADDFVKSIELDAIPGTWADVYTVTTMNEDWYVKFFIQEDGSLSLRVLSANWDGYIH